MATLAQLRQGLATRLETIAGVRAYDAEPGTPALPAAIVSEVSGEYDQTVGSGSLTRYTATVVLLVRNQKRAEDVAHELDEYLQPTGSKSVRVAVNGDPTLGGVADKALVLRFRDAGIVERNSQPHVGAFLDVEIWAS